VIARIVPLGATLVLLLGGRVCTDIPNDDDSAGGESAASSEHASESDAAQALPFVEVSVESLGPLSSDDPRAEAARLIKNAMAAKRRGDHSSVLESANAAVEIGTFAPGMALELSAEALVRLGRTEEAAKAFAKIEVTSFFWPNTVLQHARLLFKEGDIPAVLSLLGEFELASEISERFTPHQRARAQLLRSKALRARGGSDDPAAAWQACRQAWLTSSAGTQTAKEARYCINKVSRKQPPGPRPSMADLGERARQLRLAGGKQRVINLLEPFKKKLLADLSKGGEGGCRGIYEWGRAHYKLREYDLAVPLLRKVGPACSEVDVQVKAPYLQAKSESQLGRSSAAIKTYVALAERNPQHSYADDALYLAGRMARSKGQKERALEVFTTMVNTHTEGDMRGRGFWELAWIALLDERYEDALPWLEELAAIDPLGSQRDYVLMGHYWRARANLEGDSAARSGALDALAKLAKDEPMHYYGVLSFWKLASLDPAAAATVAQEQVERNKALKASGAEPASFHPERAFMEHPEVAEAILLLRGGFPRYTRRILKAVLGRTTDEPWKPQTLLFAAHLVELTGDLHRSHYLLRERFRKEHPASLPESGPQFAHAYPLAYHDEIRAAASKFPWDPMLFQGLVREESAFKSSIQSWAGAMGLSQLMWRTAQWTAKSMGIHNLRKSDLDKPVTNLAIGTTCFQGLYKSWNGHIALAIPSYNAGPGSVKRWLRARGNLDLDMWVEAIPFTETRNYIKRVTSSFQTYHVMYGEGDPYVPLRIGPVSAEINGKDPSL